MSARLQRLLTPGRFRLVDDGQARTDLISRKEFKFALRGADLGKLRAILEGTCQRIVHNNRVSVVRSVYFDDYTLSACHANVNGLGNRQKLRLRWYDRLWPRHDFFCEIKWRRNRLTGKQRSQLRSSTPLGDMTFRSICDELFTVLPPPDRHVLLKYSDPVVLVEYKREHFQSRMGDVRLTLDYDLVFYDQQGKSFLSTRFGLPLHDLCVVEAKTQPGGERALRHLLYPCSVRPTRCSKYVHACQMLGLIPPME